MVADTLYVWRFLYFDQYKNCHLSHVNSFEAQETTKMWHEARRQERKIRGMLVDYRRRAERRRDFYEKIVKFFLLSLWTFQ